MLIAEIRRKIRDIEDIAYKEDILTADVFGVLKYLPRQRYLFSVFSTLADLNNDKEEFRKHLEIIRENISKIEFKFWPNYKAPEEISSERIEPDVEISDENTLIFFEAKLKSDFGKDQIEKQLILAHQEAKDREYFLVLVTRWSSPPRIKYNNERLYFYEYLMRAGLSEISTDLGEKILENVNRVLWISWSDIRKSLEQAHKEHRESADKDSEDVLRASNILNDLGELLQMREIRPFIGILKTIEGYSHIREEKIHVRPVFISFSSRMLSLAIKYDLSKVLKYQIKGIGWHCPYKRFLPNIKILGIENVCKGRNILKEGYVFLEPHLQELASNY